MSQSATPPLPASLQAAAAGLSPEIARFVAILLETGDAMVAAVQAKLPNPESLAFEVLVRETLKREDVQRAVLVAQKQPEPVQQIPVKVSKEMLESRLINVADRAGEVKAFGAEIAALKVVASMSGLLKTEVTINHRRTVDDLSDRELEKIARSGKARVIDAEFTEE